jgi:hypothetical protein
MPVDRDRIFSVRISRRPWPRGGIPVGVRDGWPGQGGELRVQAGLVLFHGEDPVRAAFCQVGDVLTLAVQGVGGDDHIA